MTTQTAIKAILAADSTLLATATGGVWDITATGRLGINRTSTPSAFDTYGIIKPCVLVRMRSATPDYILADDANQYTSVREMIECWLYESDGIANIDIMKLRIYALLHAKQLAGTFAVRWQGDTSIMRDITRDVNILRSDYLAVVKRSV